MKLAIDTASKNEYPENWITVAIELKRQTKYYC
jgi:hypothetical protein